MGEGQYEVYQHYKAQIATQRDQLRVIFEEFCRKHSERAWLKNQGHGELDDSRLVDGLAGEKLIYKRRGKTAASFANPYQTADNEEPQKKKNFKFVVDCSGSMYRFNGHDRRLERMLETVLLLMESLPGSCDESNPLTDLISYSIVGHSGDSPEIDLGLNLAHIKPQNEKEQFAVLERIVAHSQFCMVWNF